MAPGFRDLCLLWGTGKAEEGGLRELDVEAGLPGNIGKQKARLGVSRDWSWTTTSDTQALSQLPQTVSSARKTDA